MDETTTNAVDVDVTIDHLKVTRPQPPMPPGIAKGLVVAQAAVVKVPHDGHNRHHDYRYTTAEAVIEAARKPMEAGGLALVQMVGRLTPPQRIVWWEFVDGKEVEVVDTLPASVEVRHLLTHSEGETFELQPMHVPVIPEKGRPWDKAIATAGTYALGYRLRDLLKMPRTDEADDLDRRDDKNLKERGSSRGEAKTRQPTDEEKREKLLLTIKTSLGNVPGEEFGSLRTWIEQKHAKAVKGLQAFGGDPERELDALIKVAAKRLGEDEGEVLAWIATATAKAK